jgi:ATP-dependent RNA helicase DDX49/DBP8
MAAQKTQARPLPPKQPSDEASDSSDPSSSEAESTGEASGSDSDSLDSLASRKRRRISPIDDDDDEPFVPKLSVPSRASRVQQKTQPKEANNTAHSNNGAVLAPTDPQTSFAALGVKPWLVGSLGAMAIKRPTGIQKHCIPEILKGRDCIGGSRTGSGKTVAFAVPILQQWAVDPFGIFALVLTPTRYGIPWR